MVLIYVIISLLIAYLLIRSKKNYFQDNQVLTLSVKRELLICLVLIVLSYTSLELQRIKKDNFSGFEIGNLNQTTVDQINGFDRGVAGRWDIQSKDRGKILKNIAIYLIPFSVLLYAGGFRSRLILFFIFSEGYVLTEVLTGLAKGLVNRFRPFAYRTIDQMQLLNVEAKEKFLEDIVEYDILNSFFSGDASIIAFAFVFFAYSFSVLYKESKSRNAVWIVTLIVVVLGCYFRTMSGKHFPTDVLMGAIVGMLVAFGIVMIHKKTLKSNV